MSTQIVQPIKITFVTSKAPLKNKHFCNITKLIFLNMKTFVVYFQNSQKGFP